MKKCLITLYIVISTILFDTAIVSTTLADEIVFTSLSISSTDSPQAGIPVIITAQATEATGKILYYRFYYCGNYGTTGYETTPWTIVQDYSTANSATYTFPSDGNYVIVVRAVTTPASEPSALPVIGKTITVGGNNNVNITAFTTTATASIAAGQAVTCTVSASGSQGETLYYKFFYCGNYGNASYSSTPWTVAQGYSTSNTCRYIFPTEGNFVLVARVVTDPNNEPGALPISGCTISVDPNDTFSGVWDGTWESITYGQSGDFTAEITQEGSILSGKIEIPYLGMYDTDLKGTKSGDTIVFGDIGDRIIFTGTRSANDSAAGTYVYASLGDQGNWHATRTSGGQSEETVAWIKSDMGFAFGVQERIIIGNGRNDGTKRVYTGDGIMGNSSGNIYEFTYISGQWQKVKFGSFETPYGSDDLSHLTGLAVGPGRNDGVNRLYGSGYNAAEFGFATSVFSGTRICSDLQWTNDLIVCDAKGDGKNRIYLAGWSAIHEITYSGNSFSVENIDTGNSSISRLLLIDGRNDGILRLYAASSYTNHVYEYTWTSGQWQIADCGAIQGAYTITDMVAGPGRNDGVNRLYLATSSGVFELSYSATGWQSVEIGSISHATAIALGIGRNTTARYLYIAENQNALTEYAYSGEWRKASTLLSGQPIKGIAVGNGRNDQTNGVYVTVGDNHVYEFVVQ